MSEVTGSRLFPAGCRLASVVFAAALVAACGGEEAVAPPAAFFIDGVEYAFDYQLDAQGRVDNYRIFQRFGLVYKDPPEKDDYVIECNGSFRGTYECSRRPALSMRGEGGRLVSVKDDGSPSIASYGSFSMSYGYEGSRLTRVYFSDGTVHQQWVGGYTLTHDELGRLKESNLRYDHVHLGVEMRYGSISTIAVDAAGRLLHADHLDYTIWPDGTRTWSSATQSDWSYSPEGWMTAGLTVIGYDRFETRYSSDVNGWLLTRGLSYSNDTFSFSCSPSGVSEESFTRAEPTAFYGAATHSESTYGPLAGRVRYEWGRLPSEPTFVPRALTGTKGEDFLGVISSHHRPDAVVPACSTRVGRD